MTKDKGNTTSREKPSEGARSSDTFTWDPRSDQVFTPDDSAHNSQLVGKAASFDKEAGYDFIATGAAHIVVNDDGTTTWGGGVGSQDGASSVIETLAPEGQILFTSKGRLVINAGVKLRIDHGNDAAGGRTGMGLGAREIEFQGAIEIDNGSALQVGTDVFNVSKVTLSSFISVDNGSTCRITPNVGERHITVSGVAGITVGVNSTAYFGGTTWEFSQGGMEFVLDGASDQNSGNYCYLSGFDFVKNPDLQAFFNFVTTDDDGAPLKNNGEFVFAGIGDAFQLTAMFDRQLVMIDGVPADFRTIADDFTGGDLRIRVK